MRALMFLLAMVVVAGSVLLFTGRRSGSSLADFSADEPSRFGRPVVARLPQAEAAGSVGAAVAGASSVAHPSVPVHRAQPPRLPDEVKRESTRAGQLDADPHASDLRLDEIARHLSPTERQSLRDVALDPASGGDDRATAAEVLARSKQEDAVGLLADVALRPVPAARDEHERDFERVLRARAIEGLGQNPSPSAAGALRDVLSRVNDSFLVDRAHRADWSRAAEAAPPEAQDRKALGELLAKKRR